MATKTKKENKDNGYSRSRKLSLCLHLVSLFPFIPSTTMTCHNGPNGNGIPRSPSSRASKLNLFFDTMVLKYRLYASPCESNATTPSLLTLIDPDEKYFEPYGTQPENEKITIHLGQDLDIKYLTMKNFIYLLPLMADTKQSKTDSTHTQQQDLDALTKTLLFLHQQYHQEDDDLGTILQTWQHQVLAGVTCTFSGVIPQQDTPETCRFWQLATMYGAHCCLELTGKVTHLIASRTGTTKVNKAQHYPPIHVVTLRWLLSSVALGKRQDETFYPLVSSLPASTVVTPVTTPLGNEEDEEENGLLQDTTTITLTNSQQPSLPIIDQDEIHDMNHIDWDEADREVNDYMNESGTDDNYSSGPDSPVPDAPISRKRKATSSPLALRRAKTLERGPSRLSTMMMNTGNHDQEQDQEEDEDEDSSSSLSSFAGELDDEIE